MNSAECYELKLEVITAIPDHQIVTPVNIPVDKYVQEAEQLYRCCLEDLDQLTARGLSRELVDDLPIRTRALMEAESRWKVQRFARKKAEKQWAKELPAAFDLRNLLLHEFRYAYEDHEQLALCVKEIGKGRGYGDLLQDLNSLAVMGKKYPDFLIDINFDMTLLDRAAKMADEKSTLWAQASSDRKKCNESKKIRDQAYTHLKKAVDKIRKCGQFVFWRDDRFKRYCSEHLHWKRNRKTSDTTKKRENHARPEADPNRNFSANYV